MGVGFARHLLSNSQDDLIQGMLQPSVFQVKAVVGLNKEQERSAQFQ